MALPHLYVLNFSFMQEEIKITSVTVFVNPYSEPDEEEEEKAKEENNVEDEDKVSLWNLSHRSNAFTFFSYSKLCFAKY